MLCFSQMLNKSHNSKKMHILILATGNNENYCKFSLPTLFKNLIHTIT